MPFVFAPPQQPVVPIQDERYTFFQIHRVTGSPRTGRTGYAAYTFRFSSWKPATRLQPVAEGECLTVPMPSQTRIDLKHEIELVAALGKGGRNMTLEG